MPGRWPRRSPHRVLTHAAAAPKVRTVCAVAAKRFLTERKRGWAGRRDPGRLRHDGRRLDFRLPHAAKGGRQRRSRLLGSNRMRIRQASCQFLEPARRCPQRRREASEIGDIHGKGFPSRRGAGGPSYEAPKALALEMLPREPCSRRESVSANRRSLGGSIEAGPCEKLGHPEPPKPRERIGLGVDAHAV